MIFTVCQLMQTLWDHVFGISDAVLCHLTRILSISVSDSVNKRDFLQVL